MEASKPQQAAGQAATELSEEQLHQALRQLQRTGDSLGKCLMALGWPDERQALAALARALHIRFLDLAETQVAPGAAGRIPPELIQKARVIPVTEENGSLILAMANPFDFQTVDHIRILTGKSIIRAVCTESDMEAAIQAFYGFSVERMIKHLERPEENGTVSVADVGHLREIASEPTVVNLVNLILARAVRDRASDIHIEPFQKELKVKYRIDGILHEMPSPPKHLQDAIVSRVKIMAEMNIAERYVPQDGHIELNLEGHEVDVRAATIPTIYGESVVLRLLDKAAFLFGLDQVGFEEDNLARFRNVLRFPHGIVLVCGPTGSGKTTTLYAALNDIYTPERRFITIEDPVEYELTGVNQIPVRPKRGLTFANGLRAILRQDPDIIMVGEIRDRETADIAMRSALTGHLVLTSLHTNDAPESITRLTDMGVEPYLIASAFRGALAQRLVRKVCAACRRPVEPTPQELAQLERELGLAAVADFTKSRLPGVQDAAKAAETGAPVFCRGTGCTDCKQTGFRGRTAILELLLVDEVLREFIVRRASASEIRDHMATQTRSLRQSGWLKVAQGITTPDEVLRATHAGDLEG